MVDFEVYLQGGPPWGFRLQGGREFRMPIKIAKVEPGGKAFIGGIQVGDQVAEIEEISTADMYHTEALTAVKKAQYSLSLVLTRPEKELDNEPQERTTSPTPNNRTSIVISPKRTKSIEMINRSSSEDELNANTHSNIPPGQTYMKRLVRNKTYDGGESSQQYSEYSSKSLPRERRPMKAQPRSSDDSQIDSDQSTRSLPRARTKSTTDVPSKAPAWYKDMYKEMNSSVEKESLLSKLLASDAKKGAFRKYDGATSPYNIHTVGEPTKSVTTEDVPRRLRDGRSIANHPNRKSLPNIHAASFNHVASSPRSNPDVSNKPRSGVSHDWYCHMQKGGDIPETGLAVKVDPSSTSNKLKAHSPKSPKWENKISSSILPPDLLPDEKDIAPKNLMVEYNNPPDFLELRKQELKNRELEKEREEVRRKREEERIVEETRLVDQKTREFIKIEEERRRLEIKEEELKRKELLLLQQQEEHEGRRLQDERRRKEQEEIRMLKLKEEELRRKEELLLRQEHELEQLRLLKLQEEEERRIEELQLMALKEEEECRRKQLEEEERILIQKESVLQRKREEEEHNLREMEELCKQQDIEEKLMRLEEEERLRKAEEEHFRKLEEERLRKAEEGRKRKAEEEQKRKAEEGRKRKAEEERKRKIEEERLEEKRRQEAEEQRLQKLIEEKERAEQDRVFKEKQEELLRQENEEMRLLKIKEELRQKEEELISKEEERLLETSLKQVLPPYGKAKYTFHPQGNGELGFRKGDIITILEAVDENWIEGELGDNIGIFPVSYVELLECLPSTKSSPPVVKPKPAVKPKPLKPENSLENHNGEVNNSDERLDSKYISPSRTLCEPDLEIVNNGPDIPLENGSSESHDDPLNVSMDNALEDNVNGCDVDDIVASMSSSTVKPGIALARYTFQAETESELSFQKGEEIVLLKQVDENWYEGELYGHIGILPINYVQIITEPTVESVSETLLEQEPESELKLDTVNPDPVSLADVSSSNANSDDLLQPKNSRDRVLSAEMILDDVLSAHEREKKLKEDPTIVNGHEDINGGPSIDDLIGQGEPHKAIYTYMATNEDEIDLNVGDLVHVLEKCDDNWFIGTSDQTGAFGTFPGNYVVLL